MSSLEIVELMNSEDAAVTSAVASESKAVAAAIDIITERMKAGGRLVYIGAGTSGRLGVLDAAECPPTFRTEPWQVVGVIAGGSDALTRAIEGAEDDASQADKDLADIQLSSSDVLVGIASSGRTPYVVRGLEYAKEVGAVAIGLACNPDSPISQVASLSIVPVVGPEVISGSTRLKSGTATKMVLNMLTTGTMVRLGKTYGNLMVDLRATNQKLAARSIRILQELTGVDEAEAIALLSDAETEVKTAIVMKWLGVDASEARQRLESVGGHLHRLVNSKSTPA